MPWLVLTLSCHAGGCHSGGDVSGNLKQQRGWHIEYLFAIGAASWMIHLGVVSLTFFIIQFVEPVAWAPYWYGAMLFGTGLLFALSLLFRRYDDRDPQRREFFGWLHSLATTLVGLTWGVGALACASGDAETMLYYTLVLGGTALGAVSSQHSLLRSCMLSIWTSVPLLTIAHLMHEKGAKGAASALMILLFGVTLTVVALRMRRFLIRNADLTGELAAKVEELSQITVDLSEARRRAEESDRSKSRLLAQASHDLRQPVHAIAMFVECLRDHVADGEGKRLLARIDTSLSAVARLFRSLLDITALDVGSIKPRSSIFPIGRVLGDVMRQSEELARGRSVTLCLVNSEAMVETDPGLLHTMIQNLVSNALKYGGERTLVGCRRRNGHLDIEVHDAGQGIEEADKARIFEEFVRLAPHGAGRTEGLGLGLSIVRRVADVLDLDVSVKSRQGRGSIFVLSGLRLCDGSSAAVETHEMARRGADLLHGFRVALIDDDDQAREAMATLLQRWGCDVCAHATAPLYSELTEADFLLVDQDLGPGPTGLEIARDMARNGYRNTAIISGILKPEVEREAQSLGIVMLIKPVLPAQLRSLLLASVARKAELC